MCNIAGYVGSLQATPILLKMIKAQEGLNGGFYSGLAVHDGKNLHYRKTIGGFDTLLKESDASLLQGTMGIIHTRTPSGGDASWAHPFVTMRDGELEFCYVANGAMSSFGYRREEYHALANNLQESGFDIPCKIKTEESRYCKLKSGDAVHMSDVMCQLIYKHKTKGLETTSAMTQAFLDMPSEIVGLAIEKETNDKIYFSRINKPMFVAFDNTGAYLASSPTAFPSHVKEYKLLPALSSGVVYKNGYKIIKYPTFDKKVRSFNAKTIKNASDDILKSLQSGEKRFSDLTKVFRKRFAKGQLLQDDAIIYIALYNLLKENKIKRIDTFREVGGQTAKNALFKVI